MCTPRESALGKLPADDPRLAGATIYSTLEPCSARLGMKQGGCLGQVAGDRADPYVVGSIGPAALDLLGEPVRHPDPVQAQRPGCGIDPAACRQSLPVAAGLDIGLDQPQSAGWIRGIQGAVPGSDVQQARAVEGTGEVKQMPPSLANVQ